MEGVTLLDLEKSELCEPFRELAAGKREGTVPARARRVEFEPGEFMPETAPA